jgi:hypothetical protein
MEGGRDLFEEDFYEYLCIQTAEAGNSHEKTGGNPADIRDGYLPNKKSGVLPLHDQFGRVLTSFDVV